MLEKMGDFFDARLAEYEAHQLDCIDSAREFYPFTARCLPKQPGATILDLGCGTGLELDYYFAINPSANVTGIDLAPGMLSVLKEKFPEKQIELFCGSYFDIPFEEGKYDAVVSVESLHHFTREQKAPLYTRIHSALKPSGFFLLTDYFALSEEEERFYRQEQNRLKLLQGATGDELYHYDTPLTLAHEMEILKAAGFSAVELLGQWGATHTLRAQR